jgi:hypothetical protein
MFIDNRNQMIASSFRSEISKAELRDRYYAPNGARNILTSFSINITSLRDFISRPQIVEAATGDKLKLAIHQRVN